MYPAIARYDWGNWPDWLKDAYVECVPYVKAEMNHQDGLLDLRTPNGLYNSILARTGNVELAEKLKTEFVANIELAKKMSGK